MWGVPTLFTSSWGCRACEPLDCLVPTPIIILKRWIQMGSCCKLTSYKRLPPVASARAPSSNCQCWQSFYVWLWLRDATQMFFEWQCNDGEGVRSYDWPNSWRRCTAARLYTGSLGRCWYGRQSVNREPNVVSDLQREQQRERDVTGHEDSCWMI